MPSPVHAPTDTLRAARQNQERAASYVEPRGVCLWCKTTYREGPEPVSHGVCGHTHCRRLQSEHLNEGVVLDMAWHAKAAYGRWLASTAGQDVLKDASDRADNRFRTALTKWGEDQRRCGSESRSHARAGHAPLSTDPSEGGTTPRADHPTYPSRSVSPVRAAMENRE